MTRSLLLALTVILGGCAPKPKEEPLKINMPNTDMVAFMWQKNDWYFLQGYSGRIVKTKDWKNFIDDPQSKRGER